MCGFPNCLMFMTCDLHTECGEFDVASDGCRSVRNRARIAPRASNRARRIRASGPSESSPAGENDPCRLTYRPPAAGK